MRNSWSKQAYGKGFYCGSILFKKAVNMFEHMEIAESIYKGVVEPSYKKTTWADANRSGHKINNRGGSTSSKTHPVTRESAEKRRKRYVDCFNR